MTTTAKRKKRLNGHPGIGGESNGMRRMHGTSPSKSSLPKFGDHNHASWQGYFDQIWVVNLKRRPDRLDRFLKDTKQAAWPFKKPQVFSAIEGDKVGVPKFWQTGGGSYGCLRSHLSILERAIQDDISSILVLEDDAVFIKDFGRRVLDFLGKVPDDWQCLMLGGQHVNSKPFPIDTGVVRAGSGGGIQRTHCYALRGREAMRALYITWANAAVHCDWVMGPCMAKFNTYAPEPFLVGQADGKSDISGQQNPPKFWRSPSGTEPVILLNAPREVMEALRPHGWHGGYTRDSATGIDAGLREMFEDKTLDAAQRQVRLRHWIDVIQWEVVSMAEAGICTIWHPEIKAEMLKPLVKGKLIEITASTVEEALKQLPSDLHEPVQLNAQVVLLRAPRAVMEILRDDGWHTGYWRDEVTGQDNGLRRLFASTHDELGRKAGLREIIQTLHQEVKQIHSGVISIWHDAVTRELLEAPDVNVIEIVAANANEAKMKLREATNASRA